MLWRGEKTHREVENRPQKRELPLTLPSPLPGPEVKLPIFLVGAKILERVEHVQPPGRSALAP
jgi:hypothetical protein